MTHIVEREGEIMPAYTGVNQPIYRKHEGDLIPDHDFSGLEVASTSSTEPSLLTKENNPSWPSAEQRHIGQIATAAILKGLRNRTSSPAGIHYKPR